MSKRNDDAESVHVATDDRALEIGRAMHARDTVAQNLGVILEEVRAGYARVSMPVGDRKSVV